MKLRTKKTKQSHPTTKQIGWNILNESKLAKCFLWDNCGLGCCFYDSDPFGTYSNTSDGSVIFKQTERVAIQHIVFNTSGELDQFISKFLISVANHAHRSLVIPSNRVSRYIASGSPESGGYAFAGSAIVGAQDGIIFSPALPPNIAIEVQGFPELFGMISYCDDYFGMIIHSPQKLKVVKTVPIISSAKDPIIIAKGNLL